METTDAAALTRIIRADRWLWGVLAAARTVNAPDWLIGAGALRNCVWDSLFGAATRTPPADVDLAFFDPTDLTPAGDAAVTAALRALRPDVPWEATNQAAVHCWYADSYGGDPPAPLQSSADGVGTWPETATSVAVRLLPDDSLHIVAPCGLTDLLNGIVRRNPRRVSLAQFHARLATKRIRARWPGVRVVDE
ncbi:MAG: nucleotidyltransferase family protein [Chloroflexota bacterium]|nr:nucleotidyltransferase family protein [Chloroflexota bacterium]